MILIMPGRGVGSTDKVRSDTPPRQCQKLSTVFPSAPSSEIVHLASAEGMKGLDWKERDERARLEGEG